MAKLRFEPWLAEYDTAYRADPESGVPEEITLDLELPAHEWKALSASSCEPFDSLVFVDGSRRMEARVHLEDAGWHAHGGLGTTAVGAVLVAEGTRAEFAADMRIARWCLIGSGREHPAIQLLASESWLTDLRYEPLKVPDSDPESIMKGLQARMRQEEGNLASSLVQDHPGALVICDGPLPLTGPRESMLGYIKTTSVQRLPAAQLETARNLAAGERTPIHLVGQGSFRNFEWILRLRDPAPWYYSLAGTVRLQVAAPPDATEPSDFARRVADWSCLVLPRFSSQAHQDPRAPQQLLPVRALESELGRRMGSSLLLRRRIVREYFAADD